MLARYDRYILGKLMVTFGFFTLIIVMVYWINRTIRLFDRLIGDGESMNVFLQLTALTLPYLIMIMLPLSAFAASVSTANRLGSDSEMVVLQSAGVSAFRIARPAFVLGLIAAGLMLVLAHVLVPLSRVEMALVEKDMAESVGARALDPGQFISPTSGVTAFVAEITSDGTLKNVLLSDQRNPEDRVIYTASEGFLVRSPSGPRLLLREGLAQSMDDTGTLSLLNFQDFAISLGDPEEEGDGPIRDLRAYDTLTLLSAGPDFLEPIGRRPAEALHEAHTRFSMPLLAVFTAALGFAALLVGGFSRFGFWQQVAGALMLIILIQLASNAAEDVALRSADAWPVLYAPPAFAATVVFLLLWLSDHPLRLRRIDPGGIGR